MALRSTPVATDGDFSVVGRHPSGSCASRRTTVSRGAPSQPQRPAPLVRIYDPAGEHGTIGLEPLPDGFEAAFVKAAKCSQVSAGEAHNVRHVEVFRVRV